MKKVTENSISSQRIEKERQRLSALFSSLPENQKRIVEPLIQNSAFMKVTLEELQISVAEKGTCDTYQNGANQHGTKASAELQAYNSLIKNYSLVQKQLLQLLPKETGKDPLRELLEEVGLNE